jgi:hypothetical protein
MRQPPSSVPSAIAACADRTTHVGIVPADVRCRARIGKSTNCVRDATSSPTMMPIVFWASFVPWLRL